MLRQTLSQRWSSLLGLALLVAVLLHFAIPQIAYRVARHIEEGRQDGLYQLQLREAQRQDENQLVELLRISQEIGNSIVRIYAPGEEGEFGRPLGFGVIVDSRALAVTSLTLVEGMNEIPLRFADLKEPIIAHLVASDELADLALLEFPPPVEARIAIRQIAREMPKLGQPVLALGDVADRRDTLRFGIVLGRGTQNTRVCVHEIDLIGTNVATDSNIGSPLMNTHGEILGICIAERAAENGKRGYVLPARVANQAIGDFHKFGRARHGWIGAFVHADVVPGQGAVETRVAHIDYVVPGSPAEKAGLRAGDDVMLMTQHLPVVGIPDLQRLILSTFPPEVLRLSVLRGNSFEVVTVPVEMQPLLAPSLPGEREWDLTIFCPQEPPKIDPDEIQPGVWLQVVGRRLQELGVERGDAIVGINGVPTPNLECYCRQAALAVSSRQTVRLEVLTHGQTIPHTVELVAGRQATSD
ncbi:MAG: trypsin-like peptidase domain-containing protein [Planctomycetota bacterium]|nr:trypsin-like peptidase domain-containing protein [Planctomycetota bacterium]